MNTHLSTSADSLSIPLPPLFPPSPASPLPISHSLMGDMAVVDGSKITIGHLPTSLIEGRGSSGDMAVEKTIVGQ